MPRLALISCILVLLALAAVEAPSFLLVSDPPARSDAVILFLGGERGTREREAKQLVAEGWADYLIIPARRQVQKRDPGGKLIKIDVALKPDHVKPNTAFWIEDTHEEALIARDLMARLGLRSAILVSSPYHMRRIQLIARRVFKQKPPSQEGPAAPAPSPLVKGPTTTATPPSAKGPATTASPPLIKGPPTTAPPPLEKGGGGDLVPPDRDGFALTYVPTRYESPGDGFWLFNSYDRKFILTEYAKIAWFLLYAPFV